MESTTVNIKCSKCKHFDRYYIKGVKRFNKTTFGWCTQKHNSVNIHDCCERYREGNRARELIDKRVKVCLNDLLTEISEIRKVIEAEADGAEQDE